MKFKTEIRSFALRSPFSIAGNSWTQTDALIVTLEEDGFIGRGEAEGVFYIGETLESITQLANEYLSATAGQLNRQELNASLPPGGARNAIDCALWDLEAKRRGQSIWSLTGLTPTPLQTVYTIGLQPTAEEMAVLAKEAADYPVLKIKLNQDRPVERMEAIRASRPDAVLVVDVNASWSFEELAEYAPAFARLDVSMIEQPLRRGEDDVLKGYQSPLPLCADESCLHLQELSAAANRYDMINIKLDKTGGLTEALELARQAKSLGLELMVGNMLGTSLAMAPSFVVGTLCTYVDIDGPLLLAEDETPSLRYDSNGLVHPPEPGLWG